MPWYCTSWSDQVVSNGVMRSWISAAALRTRSVMAGCGAPMQNTASGA